MIGGVLRFGSGVNAGGTDISGQAGGASGFAGGVVTGCGVPTGGLVFGLFGSCVLSIGQFLLHSV